jgi:hypothetical protein
MDRMPGDAVSAGASDGSPLTAFFRTWGPALACILAALVWMRVTGNKAPVQVSMFPWPATLDQVQVVENNGPKAIHLLRTTLPSQDSPNWSLSDVQLLQGDPADGFFPTCQVHVTVRNNSRHTYYVSAFDFSAIDAAGRKTEFDPQRMMRFEQGIVGRWVEPGDSISGWLLMFRKAAPITTILFEPDRATRMQLNSSQ